MSDTGEERCRATALMPSGLYRCVHPSGHMREGVGPQEHYYNYYRPLTAAETQRVHERSADD